MMLPPYAGLLGLTVDLSGDGPVLVMPFAEAVMGRPGFVHGGALGGLLELAAIARLRHALDDAGVVARPINLTVDYMRGGRDKDTRANGIVRRLGRRIANVDAVAWQDDPANPIAAARLTFLLRR